MSNTYTGTGGASGLEVRTFDLATDLFGIDIIEVSNGTLAVGSSPNIARITIGGGGGGGVTDIGFGTTGLTPAALTSGAVTVAGTLVAANGGTSFNTYAQGDIIYASAVDTLAKLTAGADGEVLTLAAGVPSWAASTGGIGGTIAANQVAFGTALDTIGGSANLSYDTTTLVINISDSATNTQVHPFNLIHETTAIPATGLGVGLDYSVKPPAGEVLLGRMEVQEQAVVLNNETADFVFKLRNGSGDPATTNEVFRMTNTGGFSTTTSIPSGTTVSVNPGAGGTVTVGGSGGVSIGGTGGVSTVNGAISAGGTGGAVTANTTVSAGSTVTGATGVIATTGGVLASAGGVTATLGNIVADAGNIDATAGSVSAGTSVSATTTVSAGSTVTGATGVIATSGGVTATAGGVTATAGNITAVAGNIGATAGSVSAGTSVSATTTVSAGSTVTAGTGVTATTGDILAIDGNLSADDPLGGGNGNVIATLGYSSQIAGQRLNASIPNNQDLADPQLAVYGAVQPLLGDTYTLGPYAGPVPSPGATATFLCTGATVTCAVDGGSVTSVTGGGATGVAFTCPQNESFTIYCLDPSAFFIFGNVTIL